MEIGEYIVQRIVPRLILPLPWDSITPWKDVSSERWPAELQEPWFWTGTTRAPRLQRQQWCKPRALIQRKGKIISPVIPLWEFFFGELLPLQKLIPLDRGNRYFKRDNVNPVWYRLSQPAGTTESKRKYVRKAVVIDTLASLMLMADVFPLSVDEALARWPEFKGERLQDLQATLDSVTL